MNNTTTCPSCQRPLRIPESLIGQQAKCPACGTNFLAKLDEPRPESLPTVTPREQAAEQAAARQPLVETGRENRFRNDEEERQIRKRDDEEDDDRRRRKHRNDFTDHRGGLIIALGICSFVMSPVPFGQIAWILGTHDMKEIRAGRMDPEGEGLTQIGRILGIVSTLLFLFVLLLVCLIVVVALVVAGASMPTPAGEISRLALRMF